MEYSISPKYQMKLVKEISQAIWAEYKIHNEVEFYIEKWHEVDDWNNSVNFHIVKDNGEICLMPTLHNIEGETLIKIAIDMGVETPDFIPAIATFRNEIKSSYQTASATFEKAFKQIETDPAIAVGLANSALESIIKQILTDERIKTKPKPGKTLYELASDLLKEIQLFPNSDMPSEIKTISSSLLSAAQGIEKLRSEKTHVHGKIQGEYIIEDSLYTYFIVNSVVTVGMFLNSFYKKKFPDEEKQTEPINSDDLPF